jgi:hypothetical protein
VWCSALSPIEDSIAWESIIPHGRSKARKRLGADKVFLSDVERESLPAELVESAPFRTLLLWTVLEHFREPYSVLRKLTDAVAVGRRSSSKRRTREA